MRAHLLLLTLAALLAAPSASARTQLAEREDEAPSQALAEPLPFHVYLPPGYAGSGLRYPVVYFLHGLPAPPDAYRHLGYVARALARAGRPAILVVPRGARAGEADPEYLDLGPGRNWETALARELPAYVDGRYRTVRSRSARAVVGLSAGGYGAMLLALRHLDTFSVAEAWSGYFHATAPSGRSPLPGAAPGTAAHALVPELPRRLARFPTLLAFYVGDRDDRFREENVRLDRELADAGVPHLFRVYPGGHATVLWNAHAVEWLRLALARLAPAAR